MIGAPPPSPMTAKILLSPNQSQPQGLGVKRYAHTTHMVVVKWQLDDDQGRNHAFSKTDKFFIDVFLSSVAVEEW